MPEDRSSIEIYEEELLDAVTYIPDYEDEDGDEEEQENECWD